MIINVANLASPKEAAAANASIEAQCTIVNQPRLVGG